MAEGAAVSEILEDCEELDLTGSHLPDLSGIELPDGLKVGYFLFYSGLLAFVACLIIEMEGAAAGS